MNDNNKSSTLVNLLRILVPAFDFAWNTLKYPKLIYKKSFIAEIFYRYIPLSFFFVWVFDLIPVVGNTFYLFLMLLCGYTIYGFSKAKEKSGNTLFYFMILNFGFLGIRSFVGHTFLADMVAESIGWETGSMFQKELAFYHLGISLATFVYIWRRSFGLILGIVITKSTFLLGAMGIHIYELLINNNTSPGNIGPFIIYADLIVPVVILYLLFKTQQLKLERN